MWKQIGQGKKNLQKMRHKGLCPDKLLPAHYSKKEVLHEDIGVERAKP